MAYWLIKTEPGDWSWADQQAVDREVWDGVRNRQAANNLKAMAVGDRALFYHSVTEKAAVGVVEVVAAAAPDPTDDTGQWVAVTVKALYGLARPVTLAQIKADSALAAMPLVRQSRLSVCPVTDAEWAHIHTLAETDPD